MSKLLQIIGQICDFRDGTSL